MATWGTVKANVRALLGDTGTTQKWTDAELLVYANYGIDDLSGHMPIGKTATLTADGTTAQFAVPSDLVALISVRIADNWIGEITWEAGEPFALPTNGQAFLLDWPSDGYITFVRPPASNVTLAYTAYRDRLVDNATELPFGRQRWMEQALVYYICYVAHLREGVSRANIEQWQTKMALNVGNPLTLQAQAFLVEYQRLLRENKTRSG